MLQICPKFGRVSGCCYGYCDKFSDWWIKLSALNMIGWCNCPISGIRLQPIVRFHCPIGSFCRYRKALCFWSLGTSLYLELFCFLSLFLLFYVICALVPAEAAVRFQPYKIISENKVVNAPIKFEKIVMVMIKGVIVRVIWNYDHDYPWTLRH